MNDELKSLVESAVCEELARAKQLNEDYDAVLRSLASYLGAGGYNDPSPLIDPKIAEAKIRWGIDHLCNRGVSKNEWDNNRSRNEN